MVTRAKTIDVEPDSEVAQLLDEADKAPLHLVKNGVRYRLIREDQEDDPWADYDPEAVRAGMRAAAGAWKHLDGEAMKEYIRRGREVGSRPPDRP